MYVMFSRGKWERRSIMLDGKASERKYWQSREDLAGWEVVPACSRVWDISLEGTSCQIVWQKCGTVCGSVRLQCGVCGDAAGERGWVCRQEKVKGGRVCHSETSGLHGQASGPCWKFLRREMCFRMDWACRNHYHFAEYSKMGVLKFTTTHDMWYSRIKRCYNYSSWC